MSKRGRWAGVAPEARRADRRARLIEVAFDLLGTEGLSATSVRAVCARADFNPRYFYESFPDLDALVIAVYDDVVQQLRDGVLAALAGVADPREQVHAAIDCIVRFVDDDRRRAHVLYREALGSEALNRRRIETGHGVVQFVDQYAASRHGGGQSEERIGSIGAAIFVGGLSELVLAWLDGRIDVSREHLVDDATALLIGLGDAATQLAQSRRRAR
jgi:AcrR family transcriptional regulator